MFKSKDIKGRLIEFIHMMINFTVALNKTNSKRVEKEVQDLNGVTVIETNPKEKLVKVSLDKSADEEKFKQTLNKLDCVYAIEKNKRLTVA